MSENTLILQNQRHKILFRQERIKARSQRKESCLNEVKNLSKERVPLNHEKVFFCYFIYFYCCFFRRANNSQRLCSLLFFERATSVCNG